MRRILLVLTIGAWLLGTALAQEAADIRNPDIDGETPEGKLLTDAGISEDPAQKITILENYLQRYPQHAMVGYALLQLQGLYMEKQDFAKAADMGEKLVKMVPNDVEVRDNTIKAMEGAGAYDKLLPLLVETKPIAEKEGSEYATGVVQYIEYSMLNAALKASDAKLKLAFLDALRQNYPKGQYANSAPAVDAYIIASQQTGNMDKAIEVIEGSVAANPNSPNPGHLYSLAEAYLGKRESDKAQATAERLLDVVAKGQKPDNVPAAQWDQQKAVFSAYGNFVLGRALAAKENYKEARAHLLQAVEPIQKQGGQPLGILAYFLGICYAKLDVGGDNIPQATKWMTVAAQTENPYQAEAKKTLAAIKGAR